MLAKLHAISPPRLATRPPRRGFTLIELLVVVSVISILMALTLSGVQQVREAARRMDCQNRMRQQVLGLHLYHDSHRHFPFGDDQLSKKHHSWVTQILPFLEQRSLAEQINLDVDWNDTVNRPAVETVLPVMRCPTSLLEFNGETDYAGIAGSLLASPTATHNINWNNGVLIRSTATATSPISMARIVDGTSNTICISESSDRPPEYNGFWADGRNTITHDIGPVNFDNFSSIFSRHSGGAYVALSDGAVRFLTEYIDLAILGGLCSRAGGENVSGVWDP
jgi:prepilin-type N-terminal cleavage/methylation domain-containing protein